MKKVSSVSELRAKRTDYNIPTFGFKSALVILLGAITGTIIFPLFLSIFGVSFNFSIMIGNTFVTSFAIAYARYFIETKKGKCKGFWLSYLFFGVSFGIMSYLWKYLNFFL
ncbi:MAG: hypothetical protein E6248_07995 [Clostridium sp.]|uniref:hypothetical protein n=1 Tax=Clostridium sp. TaxID=1506 RepID=UPI002914E53F|nr:hypothetical protein [Clostridium sp.]MDU5110374.1 hypothetical protein [Clostridium sp.]